MDSGRYRSDLQFLAVVTILVGKITNVGVASIPVQDKGSLASRARPVRKRVIGQVTMTAPDPVFAPSLHLLSLSSPSAPLPVLPSTLRLMFTYFGVDF